MYRYIYRYGSQKGGLLGKRNEGKQKNGGSAQSVGVADGLRKADRSAVGGTKLPRGLLKCLQITNLVL